MFIALNPTLVTGRAPWPQLAEIASQAGYAGVDIPSERVVSDGLTATKDLLMRLKLKPAVLSFPVEFRQDDEKFRSTLQTLEPIAKFGAALGCPRSATWILPSAERPKAEHRAILLQRLRESAKILNGSGIRLGLEFVSPVHLRQRFPHEFIWRMDEMLEFAQECGSNCGLLLDCWHWHHAGATVADIRKAGKSGIVHVHVNDSAANPPEKVMDNDRLMPGEGVIDLNGFFGALKQIGYQDAVSVEVFGRGLKDMTPLDAAKLGQRTAQAAMRKAGVAV
jgi:sugar phosphate isomerase/epimerase